MYSEQSEINDIFETNFEYLNSISVLSSSRRNPFILNKFLISGKILITCRELYFEVVGHVHLIRMGYLPEHEIFTPK